MTTAGRKLTKGQRAIKALANQILSKMTRLRNKASLVAGDPSAGRNLTALRNTAGELLALLEEVREPRCNVCGCTESEPCVERSSGETCGRVSADLCDHCREDVA